MRRELIFSIVGFLAGFALAAAVFFQPSPEATQPSGPSSKAPAISQAGNVESSAPSPSDPGRIGRPIAIKDDEPAGAPEPAQPKTPAAILQDAIARLPNLDERDRDRAVAELVTALRNQGTAGLQAIREYFRNGQDVKLRDGWGMSNGRITSAPSLR